MAIEIGQLRRQDDTMTSTVGLSGITFHVFSLSSMAQNDINLPVSSMSRPQV